MAKFVFLGALLILAIAYWLLAAKIFGSKKKKEVKDESKGEDISES